MDGNPQFLQGEFTPKNPRKYQGRENPIPVYRSGWELAFMRFLDRDSGILKWDSESFKIRYRNPRTGRMANYVPDFFVVQKTRSMRRSRAGIIEIKPLRHTKPEYALTDGDREAIAVNEAKWDAARKFCRKHGFEFEVCTEWELFDDPNGLKLGVPDTGMERLDAAWKEKKAKPAMAPVAWAPERVPPVQKAPAIPKKEQAPCADSRDPADDRMWYESFLARSGKPPKKDPPPAKPAEPKKQSTPQRRRPNPVPPASEPVATPPVPIIPAAKPEAACPVRRAERGGSPAAGSSRWGCAAALAVLAAASALALTALPAGEKAAVPSEAPAKPASAVQPAIPNSAPRVATRVSGRGRVHDGALRPMPPPIAPAPPVRDFRHEPSLDLTVPAPPAPKRDVRPFPGIDGLFPRIAPKAAELPAPQPDPAPIRTCPGGASCEAMAAEMDPHCLMGWKAVGDRA